jgi:hypothetical protein
MWFHAKHAHECDVLIRHNGEEPLGDTPSGEVQRRNAEFAALGQEDFAALGWPDPHTSARLFVVLVAEAALMELETGYNEAVRLALWRFARIEGNE